MSGADFTGESASVCGENAAPYVLGALGEDERKRFQSHLDTCAVCREEVAALQVVADALPAVAPQMSAPPELKRRVMASVREDLHARSGARTRAPRRRARTSSVRPALLAPAVLLALALALAVIALASAGGGASTRVVRAEVASPRASAYVRVSGGHGVLEVAGMAQAPSRRVYELWVKRSGAPQPTDALFTVSRDGRATVAVPGSLAGVKVIMVTAEPLGGSSAPTSPAVIVAHLS